MRRNKWHDQKTLRTYIFYRWKFAKRVFLSLFFLAFAEPLSLPNHSWPLSDISSPHSFPRTHVLPSTFFSFWSRISLWVSYTLPNIGRCDIYRLTVLNFNQTPIKFGRMCVLNSKFDPNRLNVRFDTCSVRRRCWGLERAWRKTARGVKIDARVKLHRQTRV